MMASDTPAGTRGRLFFLNVGHAFDHWFILIVATAVIAMEGHFGLSYAELMALSTPGFLAFGVGSIPAGWLGDRWSREGMILVFFLGMGLACALAGLARTPLEFLAALTLLGVFGAIYHPVGIAMVVEEGPPEALGRRLGVNGVWGNMGVAGAALVTGILVDVAGWRSAFLLPGVLAVATGLGYHLFLRRFGRAPRKKSRAGVPKEEMRPGWRRVLAVLAVATIMFSLQFNAVTVALPRVLEERLAGLVASTAAVGAIAAAVYAVAAFVQIAMGVALDRLAVRPLLMWVAAGQAAALVLAAFSQGWLMVASGTAVMILVFAQVPIGATLVARYTPAHIRGRIYGIQFLVVFGVGGLAVPMIALLHGTGGFLSIFLTLAVLATFTCMAGAALPRGGGTLPPGRAKRGGAADPAVVPLGEGAG